MPNTPCRIALSLALALILTLPLLNGCGETDGSNLPSNSTAQTNAQRTGAYNTKGLHSSPSVAWKFEIGNDEDWGIVSSPAVAGSMVYVGSNDSHLYALDAATGQSRWKLKMGGKVRSSPTVHEGVVYVGSDDSALYAADARTGAERWQSKTYGYFILLDKQGVCCEEYLETDLPAPGLIFYRESTGYSPFSISASPIITGGKVYFGDESAYFHAADLATGKIIWVAWDQYSGVTNTAAADAGSVYFVGDSGILISVNAETGRENWRFNSFAYIPQGSVVVADGVVYLSGFGRALDNKLGTLLAIDAATGKEKWRFERDSQYGEVSSPAISMNNIYLSIGRHLYALDAKTGQELWKADVASATQPAIADGLVYVTNSDSYLYALDADTGREQWTFKADGRIADAPAIANGMLYFRSSNGYIYALK